ncbi:MAG: hypothetical protein CMJ32_01260 [Phycisphaerae bacterium]|nr:hypothetical protein [Phycisphaerae bacterium]
MNKAPIYLGVLALGGAAVGLGQIHSATAGQDRTRGGGGNRSGQLIGADVIVGSINGVQKWSSSNGTSSYSLGTTSCNIGDQVLSWESENMLHPVIPQNMYRWEDGQLIQIGMSFCKHGFCALQQSLCGPCSPTGNGCVDSLGIGCSDPYNSWWNGEQANLGPRSEVNPHTGVFDYPFTAEPIQDGLSRRIQVDNDEFNPTLHPDARYFGEGLYIHVEDAAAGNGNNNSSVRELGVGSFSSGGYNLSLVGTTYQMVNPAELIRELDPDAYVFHVQIPGDGRATVALTVRPNQDGTYRYTYHLYNQNVARGFRSLSVVTNTSLVSNIGKSHLEQHSGENYDEVNWSEITTNTLIGWSTGSWFNNPNFNALRWGMMNTFWFDAPGLPVGGSMVLGYFEGGGSITIQGVVPGEPAPSIPGDLNNDCIVDGKDLGLLLGAWGTDGGDLNNDGKTDGEDLGIVLGAWGSNC